MDLECTMDAQDVLVLDNGSGFLKVGFSGEAAPRTVLPTCVATTIVDENKDEENSSAPKKSQSFFGEDALRASASLGEDAALTWPVQRGELMSSSTSREALESLWEHTFRNIVGVEQEDLPVLVADPLPLGQGSYASRQWLAEVMFERLKVKSLAIFNTAVLSLFSTGRTRGLVVESGEGLTQAVPVFEGFAIPHAIFKMDTAGQDITSKVSQIMLNDGLAPTEYFSNLRVMQALKEKVCSVALNYKSAIKGPDLADEESKSFELPDGSIIQVGQQVRHGAPEILFAGGDGRPSVQKICMEAIDTCDLDFRQDLIRSLVVAGGTTMLPGLAPRLRAELADLLPADLARSIDVCVDSQRHYAAWIGGSMLASLSTFDQVAVSKQEYEEGKADVRGLVARKTF